MQEVIEKLSIYYSPSEIVELLDGVDKQKTKDYALLNKVCPQCYGDLIIHTWKESRGEYMGSPAYEEMCEYVCSMCQEVYE